MDHQLAIITGGINGIGKEISSEFIKLGFSVAIFDILDLEDATTNLEKLKAIGCSEVKYYKVDVSNVHEVEKSIGEVARSMQAPKILINCAGIFPRSKALETSIAEWKNVIDVNLTGAFLCSKFCAKYMLKTGGTIINFSSKSGVLGEKMGAHYATSKAGILGLTKSLALEWAPKIRVNTVIPGLTDTNQPRLVMNSTDLKQAASHIPLQKIAKPSDIAHMVLFLVSSKADHITGQTFSVNGGSLML